MGDSVIDVGRYIFVADRQPTGSQRRFQSTARETFIIDGQLHIGRSNRTGTERGD